MEKIGIFLGFGPGQPLKNQGIGRLLAFIIKGIAEGDDKKIVIASADWYKTQINDLLADQNIDTNKIEIITTSSIPIWAKLTAFVANYQNKFKEKIDAFPRQLTFIKKALRLPKRAISKTRNILQSTYYNWALTKELTREKIFFILFFILTLPLTLLLAGLENLYCYLFHFMRRVINRLPFKPSNPFANPLYWLKKSSFLYIAYHALRTREMEKLIRQINSRTDINLWFVPGLFWPEIANIKTKKIAAAPDVVFVDFPDHFASHKYYYDYTFKCMQQAIRAADHFICYSDYVKQHHLVEPFKINPQQISVIKHGITNLADKQLQNKNLVEMAHSAATILQRYQESNLQHDHYTRDIDFSSLRFIFYSSQLRPYKNFLNLIKAYEILLRKRLINCKLITTAELKRDAEVWNYLQERRLFNDVLSFPHVSSKVLAAFNQLALCAVNPTLFEGGFPFTFSEAYSVGTPSVMSKIPVVTAEIHDVTLQQTMLFDPHDVDEMAAKIEWAIEHRAELLVLQQPLYDTFKQRTWDIVTHDYVELLSKHA